MQFDGKLKRYSATDMGVSFSAQELGELTKKCRNMLDDHRFSLFRKCAVQVPKLSLDNAKLDVVWKKGFEVQDSEV